MRAEKAETEGLEADYQATHRRRHVEKLIGAKTELGRTRGTYLETTAKRWQRPLPPVRRGPIIADPTPFRPRGTSASDPIWNKLGRQEEAGGVPDGPRPARKLVEQFPAVPPYQQELASTHDNLGVLLPVRARGRLGGETEAARDLQKKLVERFPAVPVYQQNWPPPTSTWGICSPIWAGARRRGRSTSRARDLQKKLVDQFPAIPDYQQDLAGTHNALGFLFADSTSARRRGWSTGRPATSRSSWSSSSPPSPTTSGVWPTPSTTWGFCSPISTSARSSGRSTSWPRT